MFCSIVLFRKQIVFFVNKSFFCSSYRCVISHTSSVGVPSPIRVLSRSMCIKGRHCATTPHGLKPVSASQSCVKTHCRPGLYRTRQPGFSRFWVTDGEFIHRSCAWFDKDLPRRLERSRERPGQGDEHDRHPAKERRVNQRVVEQRALAAGEQGVIGLIADRLHVDGHNHYLFFIWK